MTIRNGQFCPKAPHSIHMYMRHAGSGPAFPQVCIALTTHQGALDKTDHSVGQAHQSWQTKIHSLWLTPCVGYLSAGRVNLWSMKQGKSRWSVWSKYFLCNSQTMQTPRFLSPPAKNILFYIIQVFSPFLCLNYQNPVFCVNLGLNIFHFQLDSSNTIL